MTASHSADERFWMGVLAILGCVALAARCSSVAVVPDTDGGGQSGGATGSLPLLTGGAGVAAVSYRSRSLALAVEPAAAA